MNSTVVRDEFRWALRRLSVDELLDLIQQAEPDAKIVILSELRRRTFID